MGVVTGGANMSGCGREYTLFIFLYSLSMQHKRPRTKGILQSWTKMISLSCTLSLRSPRRDAWKLTTAPYLLLINTRNTHLLET